MRRLGTVLLAAFWVGLVGVTVATVLNRIAGAHFAPWANYISDLSVGRGGSPVAFMLMMLGLAGLMGWFFLGSARVFKESYGSAGWVDSTRVFGVVGSVAAAAIPFFPLDPAVPTVFTIHLYLGVVLFACMAVYLGSLIMVFRGQPGLLAPAVYLSAVGAVCALGFATLMFLTEIAGLIPRHPVTYLLEWAAFTAFGGWMVLTGIELRRSGSSASGSEA